MSSCSKVPEGPNTRTPATRIASLTCAAEILGRELPIARHDPFVNAADHLDAALAPVEEGVEVPAHLAEILAQGRRRRIEAREEEPFVLVELRDRHEAPALPIQFVVVSLFEVGHGDQLAVIAVGPAVISAGKARGIAVIGAAKAIAPMPAHIEKSSHDSVGATYHEHRVFAHIGREEIAGLRDLAIMAQIEPAAREDALQLLLIDLRLDKDPPADMPAGEIDQWFGGGHRSLRIPSGLTAVRRPGITMWKAAKSILIQ